MPYRDMEGASRAIAEGIKIMDKETAPYLIP
jgi:hypothetical protein